MFLYISLGNQLFDQLSSDGDMERPWLEFFQVAVDLQGLFQNWSEKADRLHDRVTLEDGTHLLKLVENSQPVQAGAVVLAGLDVFVQHQFAHQVGP